MTVEHACPVDWLFAPLTPESLARMAAEFRVDKSVMYRQRSRPPRRSNTLLAAMTPGVWVSADDLAAVLGITPRGVDTAVRRARYGGATIEKQRRLGYRLIEGVAA